MGNRHARRAGDTLTLFARRRSRITTVPGGATVIEGDVKDRAVLADALRGQDIVYANLAGDIDRQAQVIVDAVEDAGVRRLIFVTALDIYDEVPGAFGQWTRSTIGVSTLVTYTAASDVIEASMLDYTALRAAWLSDADEGSYETTQRTEPFRSTAVSRRALRLSSPTSLRTETTMSERTSA